MIRRTIGIVGCGKQGERHGAAVTKLGHNIVVADAERAAADALARKLNCGVLGVADLIADPGVAGIVVATPTPTHSRRQRRSVRKAAHPHRGRG